jgi:hypothetical protein
MKNNELNLIWEIITTNGKLNVNVDFSRESPRRHNRCYRIAEVRGMKNSLL